MTIAVTLVATVATGVTLGLLGGGGSILTVPVLVYLAGLAPKDAIAASLFVVAVTSVASLVPHARAGRVRWRTGALFGAAGMVGAYAGGVVAGHLPSGLLLGGFGLVMAVTAVAMLRGGKRSEPVAERCGADGTVARILAQGAAVGVVTGLIGAGGGFVVVPALVLLGGMAPPIAVGTSLLVIAMNSVAGLAGHLGSAHLDWTLTLAVTGTAVLGSLVGSRLTGRIDPAALRRVFGWFVVAMAVFVLAEQVPGWIWHTLAGTAWGWATLSVCPIAVVLVAAARRARRSGAERLGAVRR